MEGFLVKIIAPEFKVQYDNAASVVLLGFDGQYCFQHGHIPMAMNTVEGNAVVTDTEGVKHVCFIRGKGFAFMNDNKLVVFVDGVEETE